MAYSKGKRVKKELSQHFLRDDRVAQNIVMAVKKPQGARILEVGPGDGFLTRYILQLPIERVWAFEIDREWVEELKGRFGAEQRFSVLHEDFLTVDPAIFAEHGPWAVVANLPYRITFPILHYLKNMRHMITEGIIMMQEEVAQKVIKTRGRGFGASSLFFQHYFDWERLDLVRPEAFLPPPKILSRVMRITPRTIDIVIPDEDKFWEFVAMLFKQPRRTIRNNILQAHYAATLFDEDTLNLRAQQLKMNDFLQLWERVRQSS